MLTKTFILQCPIGLHARPASILISEAEKFKSEISIKYKAKEVSLKSIIGVMTLGIKTDDSFEVIISGEDEDLAMNRMEKFFDEEIKHL
ncbi:MAG: HPr family phosphocarrier protein [Acetivibrionales bacterium]|jgi:phosphocarrier protein|nr:HPr family phosphocarrier protein [Clostridiaceae bacterium]